TKLTERSPLSSITRTLSRGSPIRWRRCSPRCRRPWSSRAQRQQAMLSSINVLSLIFKLRKSVPFGRLYSGYGV
ncbi:hypothetical protein AAFF_G00149400, partial [Aldrovandia affinis]